MILISAFEPFGNDIINPTQLLLDKIPSKIAGCEIKKILLPVEFIKAPELLIKTYDEIKPQAVLMLGQAGGRKYISIENIAKNIMDAKIPDNSGYMPLNEEIVNGNKSLLFGNLKRDEMLNDLVIESNDAGTYVCNCLYYQMLNHNNGMVPTGFLHVPFIKEQNHMDKPYMELDIICEQIINILKIIIEEIKNDI